MSAGQGLPFDNNEEATTGFISAHVGYNITDKLYALAEMNWYTVLSTGSQIAQGLPFFVGWYQETPQPRMNGPPWGMADRPTQI